MKPQRAEVSIPLYPPNRGQPPTTDPNEQPRDFFLWSLFNVLMGYGLAYLGCLCFPALIFSIKARDCKMLGDMEGARRHSTRAKVLNIICSLLMVVTVVVAIVAIVAVIT
ncbi:interferon-induced transmembrane protein 5-like [Oxyura jamaicensis]|uniref:LOW QUALITY PROTEIN: interferon-induced transmembrane protein 5-like n=1 Tax=Oxyura jamaicensis TaxID=8884 RepID=UPI0015A54E6F|nr:LOW QUALITY PROTEIN: interferon-induced transmembrane protein 5-like [Oxyura jamaicensis]XP_035167663.1 interferon-induced transmembrane protein 5-like [Oxyura jamaicensis]